MLWKYKVYEYKAFNYLHLLECFGKFKLPLNAIYLIALNYIHNPFIGQIVFTNETPVHNRTIFNQQWIYSCQEKMS